MWKKGLFLYILLALMLWSKNIQASYNVSYGIFGTVGTAKAYLHQSHKHYSIDIYLEATGIAKFLSQGRKEHHISKGHIVNGVMISDMYQVIQSYGDVMMTKTYSIDHKNKRVQKRYRKYLHTKLQEDTIRYLDFYAEDDLLTLYFNLKRLIPDTQKPHIYHFMAVGAERQKGKVTLTIPPAKALPHYQKILGDGASWYALAMIHQKIFSSKDGELMLAIGDDGITNKAVLKDVIFFGDIRAVRTK